MIHKLQKSFVKIQDGFVTSFKHDSHPEKNKQRMQFSPDIQCSSENCVAAQWDNDFVSNIISTCVFLSIISLQTDRSEAHAALIPK